MPVYDDHKLFEMLILESFQAGLSWECVLNKREAFREAFDDFDVYKVSAYDEEKQAQLKENKGIIRNQRKILCCHIKCDYFYENPGRIRNLF